MCCSTRGNILDRLKTLAVPRKKTSALASAIQIRQDNLLDSAPSLGRKEPRDWRSARDSYADPSAPRNDELQDLYEDALLDPHLQAVQQKRLLTLQNKGFVLRRSDGEIDEEKSKWLTQQWFRALVGWVLESRFFGYSLVWIAEADPAAAALEIELVDRRRVLPQHTSLSCYYPLET